MGHLWCFGPKNVGISGLLKLIYRYFWSESDRFNGLAWMSRFSVAELLLSVKIFFSLVKSVKYLAIGCSLRFFIDFFGTMAYLGHKWMFWIRLGGSLQLGWFCLILSINFCMEGFICHIEIIDGLGLEDLFWISRNFGLKGTGLVFSLLKLILV